MAFLDAIELGSDAIAADGLGATAGDLATVAPASEATETGTGSALRSVTAGSREIGSTIPGATLPQLFDPFPGNTIATAATIGALVIGGIMLIELGVHSLLVLGILAGGMYLLTKATTGK